MNNVQAIQNYINRTRNLYFLRSVLQGLLYLLIYVLSAFLILILTDIAIHFSSFLLSTVHLLLFGSILFLFFYYIGKPLYYWFINTSKFNSFWFAQQIGYSNTTIDDKILNILELNKSHHNNELAFASIDQKARLIDLKGIEQFFSFKTLLKQIYFFLGIIGLLSLMAILNPDNFNYSTNRLIPISDQSNKVPYTISLDTEYLEVEKGNDFYLKALIEGIHKPDVLYINIGGERFFMNDSTEFFTYKFNNVRQDLAFNLENDIYNGDTYILKCIPIPILKKIEVFVKPPKYTDKEQFTIEGSGNVTFPYGSEFTWSIYTSDTDSLYFVEDSVQPILTNKPGNYNFNRTYFRDFEYQLWLINNIRKKTDSIKFKAFAIPDQYPNIKLKTSSIDLLGNYIFEGEIRDDYGFYSFDFIIKNGNEEIVKNIPLISGNVNQVFRYTGSLSDFKEQIENNNVEIFLRIKDNDPFYPYKESISQSLFGKLPTDNELSVLEDSKVNSLKNKLSIGTDLLKQLNEEKKNIRKKLLSDKTSKWERQQLSEQLQEANQELKQLSEQINQLRDDLKNLGNYDQNSELLQKKQQLEELLEKLMDEELKGLIEELEKLQNEILNNENPKLDEVDLSMDELEKHLDQNLEILKRYEVEKRQEDIIEELQKLAKDFNDTLTSKTNKEISDLKRQLDSTFNEHKENLEQNKQLENPLNLNDYKKEKEDIQKKSDQINTPEDLQNSEKNPGDDLQKLADQMQMNMNMAMQQQQAEDAAMIRNLLENLLQFSFLQEKYIEQFDSYEQYNLNELKRQQVNLKERFLVLEDSLQALMSRNTMVALSIGDQIKSVNFNFSQITETFQAERFQSIQINQQVIMKSANDLILLLNESLEQMNNSMSGMGGNCKKKGNQSKPGMKGMKKKQQGMKQSLQQMIDQLKKGSEPGKGQKSLSKQLSKMLGEQEKLQQLLQQMMQSGEVGQSTRQILQHINKMVDKNIDDIIHRNIDDNLLRRQNQILTRMLEAEKAEEEREKDKKREADRPNNYEISNPEDIFQYKEEHKLQKGIINKEKLPLKYFFQRKYDKYLNDVENN